ncbi:MAG: glycosyltransferase family 4 protein [Alphaproteobacteria bacterium]|nr:glycosyltransferase family 4 protein [Alphaproteobacteria bacterium]
MKPPDHPVPSGDRHLARLFLKALGHGGHEAELVSRFVSRDGKGDPARQARLRDIGAKLADRLTRRLAARPVHERPEAWLTYHVYHKAPDWLGPHIADAFNIPYLIAEASSAPKRAGGPWDIGYSGANEAIARADAIFTVNSDDWDCLQPVVRDPVLHRRLFPFVDAAAFDGSRARRANLRAAYAKRGGWDEDTTLLLAVGMMRPGAKQASFELLARALKVLQTDGWRLLVAGDGPQRPAVEAMFEAAAPGRVSFLGELDAGALADVYAASDILTWPAVDEAFGIALLEAQAAGLPVVAGKQRGVPDIVAPGVTGLLPAPGDPDAFAEAVDRLVGDPELRRRLGDAAARRVREQYDIPTAAAKIDATLKTVAMVVRAA